MNLYNGERRDNGTAVVDVVQGGKIYTPLPLRLDLWNHSPTGFEWGYGGSGPAQLALALLAHALEDDKRASRLHQAFKWRIVCYLPRAGWTLPQSTMIEVAADIERRLKDKGVA